MMMTYNRRFEEVVNRMPDRVAFRTKTPHGYQHITYRDLARRVRGVALGQPLQLMFNTLQSPTDDLRVRRALILGVDRASHMATLKQMRLDSLRR